MMPTVSRRELLTLIGAAPLVSAARPLERAQPTHAGSSASQVGLVSRHVQWTSLEDAIDVAKTIGFDSIEWNVRDGAHVTPENVVRDLPKAVELTKKAGMAVTMITTSIQDATSRHVDAILETAQGLGIRYYRGGQYFRYDYKRDLKTQLDELKPRMASLAALNERYGTLAAYHTHSAPGNIGGSVWDFWEVMRGLDPRLIGLNYDTGHATARGGQGWIDAASVAQKYISALAIKDFVWNRRPNGGWQTEWCPLGEGMVAFPRMFEFLEAIHFSGPINLHLEHSNLLGTDVGTWKLDMSREQFISVVGKDLQFIRTQMKQAQMA
jgi:L-ribulose-5-phosphate 3-epimerase